MIAGLNEYQPDYPHRLHDRAEDPRAEAAHGRAEARLPRRRSARRGEATTEADRAMLEQAFGCSLVNTYGCSEHLGMGGRAPAASNIVLTDHDLDLRVLSRSFGRDEPLQLHDAADPLSDGGRAAARGLGRARAVPRDREPRRPQRAAARVQDTATAARTSSARTRSTRSSSRA